MLDHAAFSLPPYTSAILKYRFGSNAERPRTLEKMGRRFGLAREQTRQIELRALDRLLVEESIWRLATSLDLRLCEEKGNGADVARGRRDRRVAALRANPV